MGELAGIRLVHAYAGVDEARVLDILHESVGDFDSFVRAMKRHLEAELSGDPND